MSIYIVIGGIILLVVVTGLGQWESKYGARDELRRQRGRR